MDFRIQQTVERLLGFLEIAYGDCDRVSIAGGAGNFKQLEDHINVSTKLHNSTNIILTIHEDCGAGAKREDLVKAQNIAKEQHPNCATRTFFIKLDGTWEELKL